MRPVFALKAFNWLNEAHHIREDNLLSLQSGNYYRCESQVQDPFTTTHLDWTHHSLAQLTHRIRRHTTLHRLEKYGLCGVARGPGSSCSRGCHPLFLWPCPLPPRSRVFWQPSLGSTWFLPTSGLSTSLLHYWYHLSFYFHKSHSLECHQNEERGPIARATKVLHVHPILTGCFLSSWVISNCVFHSFHVCEHVDSWQPSHL